MRLLFRSFLAIALLLICHITNAQVTVTSSDSLSCTVPCTTLTAHVIGDVTTDAGITVDDQYPSAANPLGFTFNFYGVPYTSCLIGPNGTICFNTSLAGAFDSWVISAPLLGNSTVYNSICGPWCDIDIVYGGTITYSTDGVAPNRKFVVSYCATHMFSCTTQFTTSQIILYETSNIVEVHVGHKDICTWNGGYAIIGVQNATGTAATAAPGRDYPAVYTCSDEAWRFTPTGGGTSYAVASIPYAPIPLASSSVYWYNNTTGAYLGTGLTYTACPTSRTEYKAGALGCADTSFGYYTVTPTGSLSITTAAANPSLCGACDGTITVGGLTPGLSDTITYNLGGVPQPPVIGVVPGSGRLVIRGLCAGTYDNIVATQGGCSSLPAGPITLINPPISISGVTTTDPSFCGVCDGGMVLAGLYPGHVFTVTYNFNGVPQAPVSTSSNGTGHITLTGLCEGTYDNIVASFGACVTPPVGPYTLLPPPLPFVYLTSFTNPTECGFCNGSITLKGVTPFSIDTIKYNILGVSQPPLVTTALADSSIYIPGLCKGNYDAFTVTIGKCVYTVVGSANLAAPPLAASFTDVIHRGCPNDSVFFTNHSTSSGPLFYVWKFGDGSTDSSTNPIHVYSQGVYTVTLIATNHLCADSATTVDSMVHPLKAAFGVTPVSRIVCQNEPLIFTDSSVGTNLRYQWTFGNGANNNSSNPTYTYQKSGVYPVRLVITDFVPCSDTTMITVYVDSATGISMSITDSVICKGTYITFKGNFTDIGNTGVTWTFGTGDSVRDLNPVYHNYDAVGTYTVTATPHYRACRDTSVSHTVTIFPTPNLYLGPDTSICPGSESITLGDAQNAPGNAKWHWNTGATTPSIVVVEPGYYSATVNISGCHSSDTVYVQTNCYLQIPNVFSPNADGLNDYFNPRESLPHGMTSFKMQLFNRWGQLIFETTNLVGSGWDGKFNNIPQPEGVYVYKIDAEFRDGQKEHRQGNVTLLR